LHPYERHHWESLKAAALGPQHRVPKCPDLFVSTNLVGMRTEEGGLTQPPAAARAGFGSSDQLAAKAGADKTRFIELVVADEKSTAIARPMWNLIEIVVGASRCSGSRPRRVETELKCLAAGLPVGAKDLVADWQPCITILSEPCA